MKRRIISILLASLMLSALLVACNPNAASENEEEGDASDEIFEDEDKDSEEVPKKREAPEVSTRQIDIGVSKSAMKAETTSDNAKGDVSEEKEDQQRSLMQAMVNATGHAPLTESGQVCEPQTPASSATSHGTDVTFTD